MNALWLLLWLLYAGLFLAIAKRDMETRLIPMRLLLALAALALFDAALLPQTGPDLAGALLGGLNGLLGFGLAYWGGRLYSRLRRVVAEVALGLGDVCLMGACGLMLGWPAVWFAIPLAIAIGGSAAVAIIFMRKRAGHSYKATQAFPYAPCILLATVAVMLVSGDLNPAPFAS